MLNNRTLHVFFAIIALLLGLGYWVWLSPVVGAADVRVHVRSAWTFHVGLLDALDYPDWDATAYGGRGNPMPRFLGPLPLLLTSLLQIIGVEVVLAVKCVVVLFALLGLAGVYSWLSLLGLSSAFLWAAVFFMVHPLVSFHLGVAFLFQNLCAYFLSSWLWYAAVLLWRGERRAIAVASLVLGLIALAHLYFALMVGYAWVLLISIGWLKTRQRRFVYAVFVVPILAMLLAAPYLLPAMLTTGDVYYQEVSKYLRPGQPGCEFIDTPVVDAGGQSLSWWQSLLELTRSPEADLPAELKNSGLVTSVLQMKNSEDRLKALRPWLLFTLVLCFVLAVAGWLRQNGVAGADRPPLWAWLLVGSGCAIMSLRFSQVFYSLLPGAMAVQFPFRWLLPAFVIWLPLVAVGPAAIVGEVSSRHKFAAWLARGSLIAVLFIGGFLQSLFWVLPDDSLKSFFANPGHLAPFYPRAVPKPREIPLMAGKPHRISIASGSGVIGDHQSGVAWMLAWGQAATPIRLHINTHYDPGWQFLLATAGKVQPEVDKNNGTMYLALPAGKWQLTMERLSPRGRSLGWVLLLVSLVLIYASARPEYCGLPSQSSRDMQ